MRSSLPRKFIFDLDGTLTRQETLPLIAEHFRLGPEIAGLTRAAVEGSLPYEACLRQRVALLGACPVSQIAALLEAVPLYPALLGFIADYPQDCLVASSNLACWAKGLAGRIACPCLFSTATVENNRVTGLQNVLKKENIVAAEQKHGHQVVFIGDGANDLAAMQQADIAVAASLTHPAAPALLNIAHYHMTDEHSLAELLRGLAAAPANLA